jgi:hypothetical protein
VLTETEMLIASAAAKGIAVDTFEADHVLLARRILARPSADPDQIGFATKVLEDFSKHLATGVESNCFSALLLDEDEEFDSQ